MVSGRCLGVVWLVSVCCQRGDSAKTSEKSSTGNISCNYCLVSKCPQLLPTLVPAARVTLASSKRRNDIWAKTNFLVILGQNGQQKVNAIFKIPKQIL